MADHAKSLDVNCWVCAHQPITLVKPANVATVSSQSFAITDSHYGSTAAIYKCESCGFLLCPELQDVIQFYQDLEDPDYEEGREERALQCSKILETISKYLSRGKLLDIGAGTGIMVEQALGMGFNAQGVEPSRWLQAQASRLKLPVLLGTFPHPECPGPFDVITLVDVIEHVPDPVALLKSIQQSLSPNGIVVVVTPDVRSFAARLLGFRWWHFRVAHIGYFDQSTLELASRRAGLNPVAFSRPAWYFRAKYLAERVLTYLPRILRIPLPGVLDRFVLPLNLRDSLLLIAKAAPEGS